MSGENHEGNKSPDICDNDNQRRFLCPRALKEVLALENKETAFAHSIELQDTSKPAKGKRGTRKRKGKRTNNSWKFFT
jgi:hypothetical protein